MIILFVTKKSSQFLDGWTKTKQEGLMNSIKTELKIVNKSFSLFATLFFIVSYNQPNLLHLI